MMSGSPGIGESETSMSTRTAGSVVRWMVLLACAVVLPASRAQAQGDGPHNLPLIPIDTNIFTPQVLVLSGNFNPQQTVLIPGADDRRRRRAGHLYPDLRARQPLRRALFLVAPISTLEALGRGLRSVAGRLRTPERRRTGLHGSDGDHARRPRRRAGAEAAASSSSFPKSFQMVAILGTSIPVGTYDSDRLINLGTNRWSFRTGVGTVFPYGEEAHGTRDEQQPVLLHRQRRRERACRGAVTGAALRAREPPHAQLHAEVLGLASSSAISTAARPRPTTTTTTT